MLVPQLLLETLEDLNDADFDKFKWYLTLKISNSCEQIAKCHLGSPQRYDTVSKMMDRYGEEKAVDMTVNILRRMKHHNAAEQLRKTYTEGAAALALGRPTGQNFAASGAAGVDTPLVLKLRFDL